MTITETTTEATIATLDTPEGTIVRLRQDHDLAMTANAGALGVVGDGSSLGDPDTYIHIKWLSGHTNGRQTQMNGGYSAHMFEIYELQVGDRVRVDSLRYFEAGMEGTIMSVPAYNNDDCMVAIDTPKKATLSYKFHSLQKIEEDGPLERLAKAFGVELTTETEDDEDGEDPLDEWEKELLGSTTAPVKGLAVGDIAVIDIANDAEAWVQIYLSDWEGLRFRVLDVFEFNVKLEDGSIDSRPDGHEINFFWAKTRLRAFDPARDLRTLEVTSIEPKGTTFSSLVGQKITSSSVLPHLPMGTVLIVADDAASPVVKLSDNQFARFCRFTGGFPEKPESDYETERIVHFADSSEDDLTIVYAPSESR